MLKSRILITAQDKERIIACIERLRELPDRRDLPHIRELEEEVQRAEIVADGASIPPEVITMRSQARLRNIDTGERIECTLVYPSEQDVDEGRISVLAPLGTAMLGYRQGDVFGLSLPKGRSEYLVEEILYQPEFVGDYHR